MHLEKTFELIRKEDTVLWIGSGFSLYAGYPTGAQLAEIIYKSLTKEELDEIQPNLQLPQLTEEYIRLKLGSRNSLNALLKKNFLKPPISKKYHEILANIPHIKTIITTNYDHLFESAYREEVHPIISESDVAYRDHRTELFKVHGDINHPDTILITKSDYDNFFHKRTKESLIWTAVKERVSNRAIVLIGYDLEDGNIKNVFKEISEALGSNRKEIILIAPSFKQHKIQYLAQLGIQYLDFKGEAFVEKLHENIKDRITTDYSNDYVSEKTLRKFFQKNNLLVELKAFEDRLKISSVKGLSGTSSGQLSMKFKNNKKFLTAFNDFAEGKKFGEISLDGNVLENFKLILNGINVTDDNLTDYKLRFASIPKKEGIVSVVFEDESEFEDIQYKLYRSKNLFEILATFKECEYIYQVRPNDILTDTQSITSAFKFIPAKQFAFVSDAIAAHKLALNIVKGIGHTIYVAEHNKGVFLKPHPSNVSIEPIESNLDFFESLKKIEKLYQTRFYNLSEFSKVDFDNVYKVLQFAEGGVHTQDWDEELTWDLNQGISLDLLFTIEEGANFIAESQVPEEITIYNQKINLGYQIVQPLDLYIENLQQVKSQATSIVRVRSRSKKVKIYYKPIKIKKESDSSEE